MQTTIDAVLIGKIQAFGPADEPSAFRKTPVDGPITITGSGLQGDEQADLQHHGGHDKALLHYARDHYACWQQQRPELNTHLRRPGAFGENFSSTGLTEDSVCLGDQFRLGTAVVEVSQGRQPCWKLGHRFGIPEMVRDVIDSRRSGWYYRVLEAGTVENGNTIALLERPYPQWPIAKVFGLLIGHDRNVADLAALNKIDVLATTWQARAQRLYHKLSNKQ